MVIKNTILSLLAILLILSQQGYQSNATINTVFEDNFTADKDASWSWNPIDSNYTISSGFFQMNVAVDENTWVDSTEWNSPHLNKSAPIGDWGIETFLRGYPTVKKAIGI